MMKILKTFTLLVFLSFLLSCEKDDKKKMDILEINSETIVDSEIYENSEGLRIKTEPKIVADILVVTITTSGCDGSTWKAQLIDKNVLAYSDPVQRFAKIKFENLEDCRAVISKTFTFDLKPLRIKSGNKVIINLDGWDKSLLYVY
ncbi:MAG: hypothetical protein BWZ00_00410 [Bacteroidetes bacterium ADurb.BinA174]|nr:MAG: hypothetical protein BWZ00_00410 [Bacteroidetes bacterium ADurb.BinA174]